MNLLSEVKLHDGVLRRYQHHSRSVQCDMKFSMYLPPQETTGSVPLLWWLSGLTCTDENFMQKSGAQRLASQLGVAIICPDTSPRGLDLPGEDESYDFGSGAGFYLNATVSPWDKHYNMFDYITDELPALVQPLFNWNSKQSISGHSMGGHGALSIALRNPGRFHSVSAFAPIVNPMNCAWGKKVFSGYLGGDESTWQAYDTCMLVKSGNSKQELLVEQGMSDEFLKDQLKLESLESACKEMQHPLIVNRQVGYDHSYYFIATFIESHLNYHAKHLGIV